MASSTSAPPSDRSGSGADDGGDTPSSGPDEGSANDTSDDRAPSDEDLSAWHFAGWGHAEKWTDLEPVDGQQRTAVTRPPTKLSELRATAICGNDITSSVLYVTAICTLAAGVYAPIALATVGVVLYLFRKVYAEVGSALPLNGGAYNVLLNTTSKYKASMAACLTLLSYIATAVISSTEALHYFHHVWAGVPIFAGTIVLLALFAVLNVMGITESSTVAVVIFALHIATLTVLVVASLAHVGADLDVLRANLADPPPGGMGKALFFGFAAGLLGISGFESSANFIEEQKPGVFPKTLRNMWIAVFFFNTAISVLALAMIRVDEFEHYTETLLAEMGTRSAGSFGPAFATWIGIDAVLVLSGAVLTAYVGVTGLVHRMALDRCLPDFLLVENRWRGTPHWIPLSFFALCVSILWITAGDVKELGGVYTISFLGVMALFAIGNRLLAVKRKRLPRDVKASWPAVIIALGAVIAGLVGKVIGNPDEALIFAIYFAITATAVTIMFGRIRILQVLLYVGRAIHEKVAQLNEHIARWTLRNIDDINSQAIVFFTRGDGPANLRRAVEYVLANEQTKTLKVVHVYGNEEDIPPKLGDQLKTLDQLFPEIRIDFIAIRGKFGPELVEQLSERLNVPRNYMFIGCPGSGFPHNLADLGGVRLIV